MWEALVFFNGLTESLWTGVGRGGGDEYRWVSRDPRVPAGVEILDQELGLSSTGAFLKVVMDGWTG